MHPAEAGDIELLHLDDACAVIVKPSGLPAVPGRDEALHDCAASRLQARCADALVVHRLDMATSGLLLFARGAEAQRRLSRAFAQREVSKRYVAVVDGRVEPASGEIDLPLAADWPNRPRQRVDAQRGKPSLTRYRVLAWNDGSTRLELEPVTGRSHQLRVHLAAIGHPILGDALYADTAQQARAPRLWLHAARLGFVHPFSGERLELASQPPF